MPEVTDSDSPAGRGAVGIVEHRRVVLGSADFLRSHGLDTGPLGGEADRLHGDGATAIFIGVDDQVAGILAIADPVKATTADALRAPPRGRDRARHAHR